MASSIRVATFEHLFQGVVDGGHGGDGVDRDVQPVQRLPVQAPVDVMRAALGRE